MPIRPKPEVPIITPVVITPPPERVIPQTGTTYPIEAWNLLYAPHLKPPVYVWHYKVEGSWMAKNFAFLQEAQQFLKQGRAKVYIHPIRGDGIVTWKPVDVPEIALKAGDKKSVGLDIYKLEQPMFRIPAEFLREGGPQWVWRASFWDGTKREGKDLEMTEQEFKAIREELPIVKRVRVVDWTNVRVWGNAPTILVQLQTKDTPIFPELEQQCIRQEGGDRDWVCREEFLGLLKLKSKAGEFELRLGGKYEGREELVKRENQNQEPKVTMQPVWPPRPQKGLRTGYTGPLEREHGGFTGPLEEIRQRLIKMKLSEGYIVTSSVHAMAEIMGERSHVVSASASVFSDDTSTPITNIKLSEYQGSFSLDMESGYTPRRGEPNKPNPREPLHLTSRNWEEIWLAIEKNLPSFALFPKAGEIDKSNMVACPYCKMEVPKHLLDLHESMTHGVKGVAGEVPTVRIVLCDGRLPKYCLELNGSRLWDKTDGIIQSVEFGSFGVAEHYVESGRLRKDLDVGKVFWRGKQAEELSTPEELVFESGRDSLWGIKANRWIRRGQKEYLFIISPHAGRKGFGIEMYVKNYDQPEKSGRPSESGGWECFSKKIQGAIDCLEQKYNVKVKITGMAPERLKQLEQEQIEEWIAPKPQAITFFDVMSDNAEKVLKGMMENSIIFCRRQKVGDDPKQEVSEYAMKVCQDNFKWMEGDLQLEVDNEDWDYHLKSGLVLRKLREILNRVYEYVDYECEKDWGVLPREPRKKELSKGEQLAERLVDVFTGAEREKLNMLADELVRKQQSMYCKAAMKDFLETFKRSMQKRVLQIR